MSCVYCLMQMKQRNESWNIKLGSVESFSPAGNPARGGPEPAARLLQAPDHDQVQQGGAVRMAGLSQVSVCFTPEFHRQAEISIYILVIVLLNIYEIHSLVKQIDLTH